MLKKIVLELVQSGFIYYICINLLKLLHMSESRRLLFQQQRMIDQKESALFHNDLLEESMKKMREEIQAKKDDTIRKVLDSIGIEWRGVFKRRRFPLIHVVHSDADELYYYNDGSIGGKFVCGFHKVMPEALKLEDGPLKIEMKFSTILEEPEYAKFKTEF